MSSRILGVTALGALGLIALAVALPATGRRGPAPVPAPTDGGEASPAADPPVPAPEDTSRESAGDSDAPSETGPSLPEPGWWVGDLHVHVSPPDAPGHSTLSVERAIDAVRRSGLDFVVLTPHAADERVAVAGAETEGAEESGQEYVRRTAAAHLARPVGDTLLEPGAAPRRPLLVVTGWEYTRESPGHLGISFVDVATVASTVEPAAAALEAGGLVVVNHPFFRPVESDLPMMRALSGDRSWKPFLGDGEVRGQWNAIEIWHDRSVWVEKLHQNSADRFPETQMVQAALAAWDAETLATRRRITAVGGSDAHGRLPYTVQPLRMVSVRVESADEDGLRRALRGAHVTFGRDGGAAARDFYAQSDLDPAEIGIGDSLVARDEVHLHWRGPATLIENGVRVGEFDSGTTRKLSEPGAFSFWRIEKPGDAYSNMIYANLEE